MPPRELESPFNDLQCADRTRDNFALGFPVSTLAHLAQLFEPFVDGGLRVLYTLVQFLWINFEQRILERALPLGVTQSMNCGARGSLMTSRHLLEMPDIMARMV